MEAIGAEQIDVSGAHFLPGDIHLHLRIDPNCTQQLISLRVNAGFFFREVAAPMQLRDK